MATLEEKLQGLRTEQQGACTELSERLVIDMGKIRGALDQRFARVEADIERLIEQVGSRHTGSIEGA